MNHWNHYSGDILKPFSTASVNRDGLAMSALCLLQPYMALRDRIIPACAEGERSKVVATRLTNDRDRVSKWRRRRFAEHRLEGLLDESRSGTPRTIENARIVAMIVRALETKPPDATHREFARHDSGLWAISLHGRADMSAGVLTQ